MPFQEIASYCTGVTGQRKLLYFNPDTHNLTQELVQDDSCELSSEPTVGQVLYSACEGATLHQVTYTGTGLYGATYQATPNSPTCQGSGGGGTGTVCNLLISAVVVTGAPTATGQGSLEMQVSTRAQTYTAVVVRLSDNQRFALSPVYTPGLFTLGQIPIGAYRIELTDSNGCTASQEYTISAPAPVVGCMDEDASNYNPLATESDVTLCTYTPRWVGVWSPDGVPVWHRPAAVPSVAFASADLYAGYPAGHSLHSVRPLAYVATVRTTVEPSGLARFDLAPYLRAELGALQADGSRRLDLNSSTAQTDDLYVGFRLEIEGRGVASGYAVNSVLSEFRLEELRSGQDPLWPFGKTMPRWGLVFDYTVSCLVNDTSGRLGKVVVARPEADPDNDWREVQLPCPANALPVAWLSPEGGFGFWVFRGNHAYGDEIGEGAPYTEAGTQELRYSSRAASRETVEAYSGVFSDRDLVEGLRTLRRAVQAWYRPQPGGPWVPIVLQGGTFPAYREGRRRYEMTIQFTEAEPQYTQGQ